MTVRENVTTKTARNHLATLRDHLAWLEERIEAKRIENRPTGHEERRVAALRWAIELGELEWDVILRRQGNAWATIDELRAREDADLVWCQDATSAAWRQVHDAYWDSCVIPVRWRRQ